MTQHCQEYLALSCTCFSSVIVPVESKMGDIATLLHTAHTQQHTSHIAWKKGSLTVTTVFRFQLSHTNTFH